MESPSPYCIARIIRDPETGTEEFQTFSDFESVSAFLTATYNWFADLLAEQRAANPDAERYPLGGFGVNLTNRWGSEIMIGAGRGIWGFWGLNPLRFFTDMPECADGLVFFIDGWHYTETYRHWLVSREQCQIWLRNWLDRNHFPEL